MPKPVIAVFDVGKTNKKLFLFDEDYKVVFEKSTPLSETVDEDGDPCENIDRLKFAIIDSLHTVLSHNDFTVKAINFAAYGASFVYTDEHGKTIAPLYNYLKSYPEALKKKFYDSYEREEKFSFQTASPVLGSLNSGMQLYRIKYQKPDLFKRIKYAFHLPQYLSFLISEKAYSEITSIGCHTNLWDFQKNDYHDWVRIEGILEKLPPIALSSTVTLPSPSTHYSIGIGLHDSSAALIPYQINFKEPFVLISTGTWCISLNPFNHEPLTSDELVCDCLCYLQYNGNPVKASRLFAGFEHDNQVKRIASYFNHDIERYQSIAFNHDIVAGLKKEDGSSSIQNIKSFLTKPLFENRELSNFTTGDEAYHQLIFDLVTRQHASTQLILKGPFVKRIFVDGGFSKNDVYMNLLASVFPGIEVFAATVPQATALGAAMVIHDAWTSSHVPENLIQLKHYPRASANR